MNDDTLIIDLCYVLLESLAAENEEKEPPEKFVSEKIIAVFRPFSILLHISLDVARNFEMRERTKKWNYE